MATKFSEIFAISMLKKNKKFCRRGLTHLDATPTFKNRPNTYGQPCTYLLPCSINFKNTTIPTYPVFTYYIR